MILQHYFLTDDFTFFNKIIRGRKQILQYSYTSYRESGNNSSKLRQFPLVSLIIICTFGKKRSSKETIPIFTNSIV